MNTPITPTPLDDPFYYLCNMQQVVQFCLTRYHDLWLAEEHKRLQTFLALSKPAQGLLVRLVMRKGCLFRADKLVYAEIPNVERAIAELSEAGFVEPAPSLTLSELCALARREECVQLAKHRLPKLAFAANARKRDLEAALLTEQPTATQPLAAWWPQAPFAVIGLACHELFDRLRLMFFGNLHQDWSEFVLTELGLQRFEPVSLSEASRPFQHRAELNAMLALHRLQERMDEQPVAELCEILPAPVHCEWIDYRRHKLLFRLGREAERQGDTALALELHEQSRHREARIRALRLREKSDAPARVAELAQRALAEIEQPEARLSLSSILQRSAKKAGLTVPAAPALKVPTARLVLQKPEQHRVEAAVMAHFANEHTRLFHVENRLFNGLFALLFWPALFAPVRGAFFNPFQAGPADLYRPGFASARHDKIECGFTTLANGDYRHLILEQYRQKQGISCSFLHWPSLPFELVELALAVIPAAHLEAIFRHLLLDLRHHRKGMPDLIELNTNTGSYRLIEVKGPGDRLQDHQRLWIRAMLDHGLPVSVCEVSWQE
ncbi:VRR-NUC domain-containing protein [Oceanimonas sp. CHS3-5]|uniref:VRR-NUC domain-containing protein n=1 Tax=Oceanimonas sp. CHS3-5 TaxID=3068186 RepID=UPI00273F1B29|nr:VRR-NUC domain-containing protein [Oceanimonas sp. CHS3-5]MDP5292558.1 VRR-NUC domain-containing protein [Oceanimonas sp. CHS3-5]